MPRKKTITLEDIAKELGLSRITVSKALRGMPGMSLETRRAVIERAAELGYLTREQNEEALFHTLPMKQLQKRRFAFVIPDRHHEMPQVVLLLLQGLNECYQGTNYQVVPVFMPVHSPEGWTFEEWAEHSGTIHMDGIFIAPMFPEELEAMLLELPVPRILLNIPPTGAHADSVIWDVQDAVKQAVRLLASKDRFPLMYIGDNRRSRGYKARWSAFVETMAELGQPVSAAEHFVRFDPESEVWADVLQKRILHRKPAALLNAIESNLPWVTYICQKSGLRIPQDCALVSLEISDSTALDGVSRFYMPIREAGCRAADRMIWRIANPSQPFEQIRIQGRFLPDIHVRRS